MPTQTKGKETPWVIFSLDRQRYAVSSRMVREMTMVENLASLPAAPPFVRGVFNLRGSVLPVFDLRTWLGLPSAREQVERLIGEMHQREQEHRDWLADLMASVKEEKPFTKAIDPHQCAFGKWYDQYETDDIFIRSVLREFENPHQALHGVATNALQLVEQGHRDAAIELIDKARDLELKRMIELFGRFREDLQASLRESVIVVEINKRAGALIVDTIESVELLEDAFESLATLQEDPQQRLVPSIGRRLKDGSPVLIPDVARLLDEVDDIATDRMPETVS